MRQKGFLDWARETNHEEAWRGLMHTMSSLERKIVFLVFRHGTNSVKAISQFGFLDQRTTASALSQLKKQGIVCSVKKGRESHYSIAEAGLYSFLQAGDHRTVQKESQCQKSSPA